MNADTGTFEYKSAIVWHRLTHFHLVESVNIHGGSVTATTADCQNSTMQIL